MQVFIIETGIKNKLKIGAVWNSVAQFGQQGINFILTLILARLLTPEDFGLLGMATVISGFISYFSEFGLIASLIKKAQVDDQDCDTAFWACVLFSALTYITIYLLAPLIAVFYHRQELVAITRAVSVVFLISMYTHVPYALETKKLKYDRITVIRLVSLLVSGLLATLLALQGFGVWALVWQQIVMHFVQMLGYLIAFRWVPHLRFSVHRFNELAVFGFHITVNNLLKFASENIDYLLVGKLLGPSALGVYTIAFRLSRYPIEKLWGIFGKMMLPAFAMMQDDVERIKRNVIRVSSIGMLVVMPLLVTILNATPAYVHLTVGDKWGSTVPLIRVFVVYLIVMSISFSDETTLIVSGKIRVVNALRFVCSLSILILGYMVTKRFGLFGMAVSYSLMVTAYLTLVKLALLRTLQWTMHSYVKGLKNVFMYCTVILVVGFICQQMSSHIIGSLAWVVMGVGCSALITLSVHSKKNVKNMISQILT